MARTRKTRKAPKARKKTHSHAHSHGGKTKKRR